VAQGATPTSRGIASAAGPDGPDARMRMPDGAGTVSNTNDGASGLSKDRGLPAL